MGKTKIKCNALSVITFPSDVSRSLALNRVALEVSPNLTKQKSLHQCKLFCGYRRVIAAMRHHAHFLIRTYKFLLVIVLIIIGGIILKTLTYSQYSALPSFPGPDQYQ
jgi:hypothetical protein